MLYPVNTNKPAFQMLMKLSENVQIVGHKKWKLINSKSRNGKDIFWSPHDKKFNFQSPPPTKKRPPSMEKENPLLISWDKDKIEFRISEYVEWNNTKITK